MSGETIVRRVPSPSPGRTEEETVEEVEVVESVADVLEFWTGFL